MAQLVCSPWHNICLRIFAGFAKVLVGGGGGVGEMKKIDRPPPHQDQGALELVNSLTGICVHPFYLNFLRSLFTLFPNKNSTVMPP